MKSITWGSKVLKCLKYFKSHGVSFDQEEFGSAMQLKFKFLMMEKHVVDMLFSFIEKVHGSNNHYKSIEILCLVYTNTDKSWTVTYEMICSICGGKTIDLRELSDEMKVSDCTCCGCIHVNDLTI